MGKRKIAALAKKIIVKIKVLLEKIKKKGLAGDLAKSGARRTD